MQSISLYRGWEDRRWGSYRHWWTSSHWKLRWWTWGWNMSHRELWWRHPCCFIGTCWGKGGWAFITRGWLWPLIDCLRETGLIGTLTTGRPLPTGLWKPLCGFGVPGGKNLFESWNPAGLEPCLANMMGEDLALWFKAPEPMDALWMEDLNGGTFCIWGVPWWPFFEKLDWQEMA